MQNIEHDETPQVNGERERETGRSTRVRHMNVKNIQQHKMEGSNDFHPNFNNASRIKKTGVHTTS